MSIHAPTRPTMKDHRHRLLACLLLLLPMCVAAQGLRSPESVAYHAPSRSFFLSSLDTNCIYRWREGVAEPFLPTVAPSLGIALHRGMAYVALDFEGQADEVRGYDLRSKAEVFQLPIPNSVQLNDVEFDHKGRLYVSDRMDGVVYRIDLQTRALEIVVPKGVIDTPNGLYCDRINQRLLICNTVANSSLYSLDLRTNAFVTLVETGHPHLDGITMDRQGNAYVTSWSQDWRSSTLLRIDPMLRMETLLENQLGMADITFSKRLNSILIANIYGNSLLQHRLEE